jgi:hypothetical protein
MKATPEQLKDLNVMQSSYYSHPFTCCNANRSKCPKDPNNRDQGCLIPTEDGFICPCGKYKQEYDKETFELVKLAHASHRSMTNKIK